MFDFFLFKQAIQHAYEVLEATEFKNVTLIEVMRSRIGKTQTKITELRVELRNTTYEYAIQFEKHHVRILLYPH